MITLVLIVLGLCLGSFVNALVWRLRQQETSKKKAKNAAYSITKGRSMCTHCKHLLAAKDLIPLGSWLCLLGKCRYCRKPIGLQYPAVEFLTASLFVFSYVFWPTTITGPVDWLQFGAWLIFITGFMALTVYDLRWYLLPNRIVFPLTALALLQVILLAATADNSLAVAGEAIWGFLIGGGIFWILFQLSNGEWIGGGDVKLGWLLGIIVGGPAASLLLIFLASLIGLLVSLPLLVLQRANRKTQLPFGPFLIAATIVVQLFGSSIIDWYKALVGI